jgi:hypothetical protein
MRSTPAQTNIAILTFEKAAPDGSAVIEARSPIAALFPEQ